MVSLGGRRVVDGVGFAVAGGEVVGLLGPNGAGKTTTLRALLGLQRADEGVAEIRGSVGYLPEDHVGDPASSVRAYLGMLAAAKGFAGGARRDAVDAVTGALDLDALVRRPLGRLSRGQRQRVGVAQALLGDPDVVVLDEPTAGLDPAQAATHRRVVRERADAGAAVLLSTHVLSEVAALCDRVVVVVDGRTVADERAADIPDLEDRFLRLVGESGLR